MPKMLALTAGTTVFSVQNGNSFMGLKMEGRDYLVLYRTHEEAGTVALDTETCNVCSAPYKEWIKYSLASGRGIVMISDGDVYTIEAVYPNPIVRALSGAPSNTPA